MKESKMSIKAIDAELERCHTLLHSNALDSDVDRVWLAKKMREMQDLLIQLTKRWNGMEY